MKRYLAIMASLVTSTLFNVVYADIVIPESGLLVCTPDRPYTVSKENGSIGIEAGQKPCIVEAEENPFILYSIYKSDYCIDMDYIGSNCGKGGSGGSGEASGPFPDKLNWNDTNKLAEYNQGRYNTNRGQFFDKGIGGCIRGSSLNFSGEISSMADCDDKDKKTALVPKPEGDISNPKTRDKLMAEYLAIDCAAGGRRSYKACAGEIEARMTRAGGKTMMGNAALELLKRYDGVIRGVFGVNVDLITPAIQKFDREIAEVGLVVLKDFSAARKLETLVIDATGSLFADIIRDPATQRPTGMEVTLSILDRGMHKTLGNIEYKIYATFRAMVGYDPDKGRDDSILSDIAKKISSVNSNWAVHVSITLYNKVTDKLVLVQYHLATMKDTERSIPITIAGKTYYYVVDTHTHTNPRL